MHYLILALLGVSGFCSVIFLAERIRGGLDAVAAAIKENLR